MTVKTTDFCNDGFSARRGFLRLFKHADEFATGTYWTGEYIDPRGIVAIYRQDGDHPLTRVDFVHADRCWVRSWQAAWGDRTIPGLARQFIEDVLDGDLA